MIQSIKEYLNKQNVVGDIILYRDKSHKKKAMCEYLAKNISTDKTIYVKSGGAFGLYIAKAFPNNQVKIFGNISAEYLQQIDKLENTSVKSSAYFAEMQSVDALYIDQYSEPLIEQFYTEHFKEIAEEVRDIKIDAFCDCGHSCATMSGAIKSGLDYQFILGVNRPEERKSLNHLSDKTNKFTQEYAQSFDTLKIQQELEAMYPDFGNIFEATRSISAAMLWLIKNPGKTVLVYVGDSPVFGEDTELN